MPERLSYEPTSLSIPKPQARRANSMPLLPKLPSMPTITPHPPILPLSTASASPPSSTRKFRSTSRRFSYNLKNRAGRYAVPLSISTFLAVVFLLYTWSNSTHYPHRISRTNGGKLHLYTRNQHPLEKGKDGQTSHDTHGVSILTQTEDELIAEDDLFWQSYEEPAPLSAEEEAAEKEIQAHREDVLEHDKRHSMEALVWWLAEGGIIPRKFNIPSKKELKKMGGRGVEQMLDELESAYEGESIFPEGWADYAKKQYRIVLFSKTYCPFSKKAKSILENYRLTPAPFIIELDRRSDMDQIQSLLQRLTGRRTVPNVILDFDSIGGSDELTLLHAEGGLQRTFEDMAVLPGYRRRVTPARLPQIVDPIPAVAAAAAPVQEKNLEKKEKKPVANNEPVARLEGAYMDGDVFVENYEDDEYSQATYLEDDSADEVEAYDDSEFEGDELEDGVEEEFEGNEPLQEAEADAANEAKAVDRNAPIDFKAAIKAAHDKMDYVQGMGAWDGYAPLDVDPHADLPPQHQKFKDALVQPVQPGHPVAMAKEAVVKAKAKPQHKQNKLVKQDNVKIDNLLVEHALGRQEPLAVDVESATPDVVEPDQMAVNGLATSPAKEAETETETQSETEPVVEEEQDELTRLRARLAELEALAAQGAGTTASKNNDVPDVSTSNTDELQLTEQDSEFSPSDERDLPVVHAKLAVDPKADVDPRLAVHADDVLPPPQRHKQMHDKEKIAANVKDAKGAIANPKKEERERKAAEQQAKALADNRARIEQAKARIQAAKARKQQAVEEDKAKAQILQAQLLAQAQAKQVPVQEKKAKANVNAKVKAKEKENVKGKQEKAGKKVTGKKEQMDDKLIKNEEIKAQKAPQPRYPQKNGAAALAAAARMRRIPAKKGKVVG